MTKADLKTGHIVTLRNGVKHIVYRDCCLFSNADVIVNCKKLSWDKLANYNEDMTQVDGYKNLDIMRVETPTHPFDYNRNPDDPYYKGCVKTIWKRTEKKKYTYEQLKEILGEEFEIVKE